MDGHAGQSRDLGRLVVARVGRLVATGDTWEPFRLVDADGVVVTAVAEFLADLQGPGRAASTLYSYGHDLLRWFRFLWAVGVVWDRASRLEARDFSRWMQRTDKARGRASGRTQPARPANSVTGKVPVASTYAPASRAHSETVLRRFYDFHRDMGTGPLLNPFPLARSRASRMHEHHNPMQPWRQERAGLYRPRLTKRIPRSISDEQFNELFAALTCHRDRALVALWVSTGARAAELLGLVGADVDVGQQLVTVRRKGSEIRQSLPASSDALVWLRLYQHEYRGYVPAGARQPVWWTLRPPFRPLSYHAARAALNRAQAVLGSNWSLHDFRHTAAYRMARDPQLDLTDVQWVLGHARLSTTQIYTTPHEVEVIEQVRRHQERRALSKDEPAPPAASGYRREVLETLLGPVIR